MRTLTGWRRLAAIGTLAGPLSLLLPATGSLASEPQILGRITDPDGAVVADAMVFLTPVNHANGAALLPTRTLRSDRDGAFYAALPAGRYRVAAVKQGYDVAMTDLHSRARGVLKLEMTRSYGLSPGNGPPDATGGDLGTSWILRQQRDNVLRAVHPDPAGTAAHGEAVRAEISAAGLEGWAAALFNPLDGHFLQQFSGGPSRAADGEAGLGRITGMSLSGVLVEDVRWRFDGWSGRTLDEVNDAGSRLEERDNRAAIGFDYHPEGRDSFTGDLSYGARRYTVEAGAGTPQGTEQAQRSVAVRSRWERQVDGESALYVEGRYVETGARQADRAVAEGPIEDRSLLASTGLALQAGDHRIDLGLATEQFDYGGWDEGLFLYGNGDVPGPGIAPGAGPAFSLQAADRWQTGALTEVSYALQYHNQPRSGASYAVPRVGVALTPPGPSGVVVRSEILYRVDGDARPDATGGGAQDGEESDRLGYRVGVERRPRRSDDRLHLAASYSYRPFVDRWPAGMVSGGGLPDGAPLVLGDGSTSRHELEVEMAHAVGPFRGGMAGSVGRAEGRLSPAVNEAPVQLLADAEARYYRTRLWAACVRTDTEVQLDYRRVLTAERLAAPGVEPSDYRRLDLVVYQQIPGPRALREARLRVLMAYQGFDYDALYDGPEGATVSGRASRVTGGLDISF